MVIDADATSKINCAFSNISAGLFVYDNEKVRSFWMSLSEDERQKLLLEMRGTVINWIFHNDPVCNKEETSISPEVLISKEEAVNRAVNKAVEENDKEWFQIIESVLGFHPVSATEALNVGIEKVKSMRSDILRKSSEVSDLRARVISAIMDDPSFVSPAENTKSESGAKLCTCSNEKSAVEVVFEDDKTCKSCLEWTKKESLRSNDMKMPGTCWENVTEKDGESEICSKYNTSCGEKK